MLYQEYRPGDNPNNYLSSIESTYAPDVEWTFGGCENKSIPLCGTFFGHQGISKFLSQVQETVTVTKWETKDVIAQNDKVVVVLDAQYTVKKTGKSYKVEEVHIHTVRNFQSQRVKIYFDYTPALEAWT